MLRTVSALAVALSLTVAGLGDASAKAGVRGGTVKKKIFDFEGDDIEGALLTPEGEFLGGRATVHYHTLIEYRFDFIPELLKTTEDL